LWFTQAWKETYADKADWSVFPECVKTGKNIIANGDIKTKEDVEKMKDCKGIMIGREAVTNPLIFAQLKGLDASSIDVVKAEYERLAKERNAHPKYGSMFSNILEKIVLSWNREFRIVRVPSETLPARKS